MKKTILSLIFIALLSSAYTQQVTWGNSAINQRTEWYLPNSPTNQDGNRQVIGWVKGTGAFQMNTDSIKFGSLVGTGNRFVISSPSGRLINKSYYEVIDTTILATKTFVNGYFQPIGSCIIASDTVGKWKPIGWQPDLSGYLLVSDTANMLSSYVRTSVYTTGLATKFNNPTGNTSEYLRGDGSTATFPSSKTPIPYTGTTNASGQYSYTFPVAYSVAPNIQANIIGGTDTQNIRITSITTTGFTVLVRNRTDVIGLLPSYSNVNGATVDVLITEK